MRSERDETVDIVKGIGILLVLLGHVVPYGSYPCRYIFSFHMPLFFIVSGVLFRPERYGSWSGVMAVMRRFVFWYVFFVLVGCFRIPFQPWLIPRAQKDFLIGLWTIFPNGHPFLNGPCWFFVTLALSLIVYSRLRKWISGRDAVARMLLCFGSLCSLAYGCQFLPFAFRHHYVPLLLTNVPMAVLYLLIGEYCFAFLMVLVKKFASPLCSLALAIVGGVLIHLMLPFCGQVNASVAEVGGVLAIPSAIVGSMTIVCVANCVGRIKMLGICAHALMRIGRRSLIFFSLDFVTLAMITWLLSLAIPDLAGYRPTMRIPYALAMLVFVLQVGALNFVSGPMFSITSWLLVMVERRIQK